MHQRKLADRIALSATSATVTLMFVLIIWVAPIVTTATRLEQAFAALGAVIATLGAYRLISKLLTWLIGRSLMFRRFVLGKEFLEGTWVGSYKREGGPRLTVEYFDQSEGETRVHGRSFAPDGQTVATWNSIVAWIDPRHEKLYYGYQCDLFDRTGEHSGLAMFKIIYKQGGGKAYVLDGYAADLTDGKKDTNREIKISDQRVDDQEAFTRALELQQSRSS